MPITVNGSSDWLKTFAEWTEGDTAYLSVVFSWDLQAAYQRAVWLKAQGYSVRVGGPAVMCNPGQFSYVATEEWALSPGDKPNALAHHNSNATFTSRGCIRRCSFCAVPKIEGDLVELSDWEPKPLVCDNNLLACSRAHFDRVIDRLKPISGVDFNQGLDARLMKSHHANRLAELDLSAVRLAWDSIKSESSFMRAYELLRKAGISKRTIRVYVLIGYKDDPEDAWYRLETVRKLGATPNPMRFQPLDSVVKDSYVADGWTDRELRRYVRYFSNLAHLGGIPFGEFEY
jgi:hypothetical protein